MPADAAAVKILCVSPRPDGGGGEHRNLYQSGYFKVSGEIYGSCELGEFRLWDAGFDFYAPQTFGAEDGRRILIGWMGMPDDPTYGNDPTVAEGWQHCLTLPREITVGEDGVVRQAPVRELKNLRGMRRTAESALKLDEVSEAFDIEIDGIDAEFSVTLGGELSISWRAERDGTPPGLRCALHIQGAPHPAAAAPPVGNVSTGWITFALLLTPRRSRSSPMMASLP